LVLELAERIASDDFARIAPHPEFPQAFLTSLICAAAAEQADLDPARASATAPTQPSLMQRLLPRMIMLIGDMRHRRCHHAADQNVATFRSWPIPAASASPSLIPDARTRGEVA
jgi:hypothetical protein